MTTIHSDENKDHLSGFYEKASSALGNCFFKDGELKIESEKDAADYKFLMKFGSLLKAIHKNKETDTDLSDDKHDEIIEDAMREDAEYEEMNLCEEEYRSNILEL